MLLGMFCMVGNCFRNALALATRPFSILISFALAGVEVEALAAFFKIGAGALRLVFFLDFILEG